MRKENSVSYTSVKLISSTNQHVFMCSLINTVNVRRLSALRTTSPTCCLCRLTGTWFQSLCCLAKEQLQGLSVLGAKKPCTSHVLFSPLLFSSSTSSFGCHGTCHRCCCPLQLISQLTRRSTSSASHITSSNETSLMRPTPSGSLPGGYKPVTRSSR